jgi:hypothetical protein
LVAPHCLQHFTAGSPGQIQVDDGEVGTADRRIFQCPDKGDRLFPIGKKGQMAGYSVLFERPANQAGVGRVIFHKHDGYILAIGLAATRFRAGP